MNAQLYKVEGLLFSLIIIRQLCSHKSDLTSLKILQNYRSNSRCAHVLQSNNSIVLIEIENIVFTFFDSGLNNFIAFYLVVSDIMPLRIDVD